MKKSIIFSSILFFLTLLQGKDCGEVYAQCNTWIQKMDFGGTARRGAVGFSIGNKGYIGTGYDGAAKKDFWEYDMPGNTWSQKADFGGTARGGVVGFSIGSKGYVGTGNDGVNNLKDFWEYDTTSNAWTQKADFGGTARRNVAGFSIGTKGYVGTGYDGVNNLKDFWEYDPLTDTWTQKADFGGPAKNLAVGFSIGSKGYFGTGGAGSGTKDFWEYDPGSNTWTQKADFGGVARSQAEGFSIGDKGYIGTGWTGGASKYKDFWEYNPLTDTWTQKADFGGSARRLATAFSIGSKGYIGTGWDNVANLADFWEYTPELTAKAGTDTSVICAGDSVTIGGSPTALGGNGIYTYSWTPSAGLNDTTLANPTASPSDTTTYIVTVTDSNGCIATDSMKLSVYLSGIQTSAITGLTSVNVNALESYAVAFHAGSIYDWSVIGGNQTNGGQTNFINIQWGTIGTGQVTVVETDSLGCVVDTVALIVNIGGTGINENQPESIGINIYPNPNTGEFTVKLNIQKSSILLINIYQIDGQLIFKKEVVNIAGNYTEQIDFGKYAKGLYYLQIVTDKSVIIKKIIICQ